MGIDFQLAGRFSGGFLGLFPAGAKAFLDRLEAAGREAWPRTLRRVVPTANGGELGLGFDLHPAGGEAWFTVPGRGRVRVNCRTSGIGPGFHLHVVRGIDAIAKALGIAWDPESEECFDETGYFFERDDSALDTAMLRHAEAVLLHVTEALQAGATRLALSLPMERRLTAPGDIHTALGPRDTQWLADRVEIPGRARDLFPWWNDALDAEFHANAALCIAWSDLRWHLPPDDGERPLLAECEAHWRAALALDPRIDLPFREWHEVLDLLSAPEDETRALVRERAAAIDPDLPRIGYRRHPVRHCLPGGWSLEVPGDFAERLTNEGVFRVAGGDRVVEIRSGVLPPTAREAPRTAADIASHFGALFEGRTPEVHRANGIEFRTVALGPTPRHPGERLVGLAATEAGHFALFLLGPATGDGLAWCRGVLDTIKWDPPPELQQRTYP